MSDSRETERRLLEEVAVLRQRVSELEAETQVQNVAERQQAEEATRVSLAVQRVRNEVLQMQSDQDWERVLLSFHTEAKQLVRFNGCGINLTEASDDRMTLYLLGPEPHIEHRGAPIPPVIRRALETSCSQYRKNRADPYFGAEMPETIHSVVDVPFTGGTVALNSIQEDGFSQRDIRILEQFSQVMAEARRRLHDLQALAAARRQAEEESARALRREAAMGRIRDQILGLRHLAEVAPQLEGEWVAQLRELGIPVNRVSLEFPSTNEGRYVFSRSLLLGSREPSEEFELSLSPWIEEAWRTGAPVAVGRDRLEAEGFPAGVRSLVEVPLPGGGSMGANSEMENAFDAEAVRALQVFAGLLATALRRLRDVEALRQAEEVARIDLALQRVRNEALQMRDAEDWSRVLLAFDDGLRSFVAFEECGINIVDLQNHRVTVHGVVPGNAAMRQEQNHVHPALRKAMESGRFVYRRNRSDALFPVEMEPRIQSVLDVPFMGGTVAVNSTEEDGFSERDIEILARFAESMSEAYRRLQDLVERKRLEQQLIRLERLNALGELSAGFCHNFNNILTGILGPAQLLQHVSSDPEVLALADDVAASGVRAGDLVRRLNEAMRGEPAGELYGVSLNEEVLQAVQAVRPRWKDEAEAQGISIDIHTAFGHVPAIAGRSSELHDLLVNLLLNAVEAMPRGGRVTFRTQRVGADVQLTVADTGIGMDAETQRRAFEPFFTTKAGVGTGLGLATVYGTVQRWRGGIEVVSAPGQGTTFTLRFPAWSEPPTAGAPATPTTPPVRAGRLLAIEDDPGVNSLLARLLGRTHQVETATDGAEALAQVVPGRYDVVLIDLGLPGMPGDQVAEALRQLDPEVATVLVTGWALGADDPRLALFDFHLEKPFADLRGVEVVVARAIELTGQRRR